MSSSTSLRGRADERQASAIERQELNRRPLSETVVEPVNDRDGRKAAIGESEVADAVSAEFP